MERRWAGPVGGRFAVSSASSSMTSPAPATAVVTPGTIETPLPNPDPDPNPDDGSPEHSRCRRGLGGAMGVGIGETGERFADAVLIVGIGDGNGCPSLDERAGQGFGEWRPRVHKVCGLSRLPRDFWGIGPYADRGTAGQDERKDAETSSPVEVGVAIHRSNRKEHSQT